MTDVTQILTRMERGDHSARDALFPLVYSELRRIAAAFMAQERPGHSLEPTALVHEAYLRLVGPAGLPAFANRRHFFAAVAESMRRILIDEARRRQRDKRGGDLHRVELPDVAAPVTDDQLTAVAEVLPRLAAEDPLAAEVVDLKCFAGLGRETIAELLGLSLHEVRQKWTFARAWLRAAVDREL
jgi:RNA polymerase sigma factor (TIGR02999 family)